MQSPSAVALFCEDIREEKNDVITLIGLLPDNVQVEAPTSTTTTSNRIIGKLCVFVRINFDPDDVLQVPELRLVMPNNEIIRMGGVSSDIAEKAKSEAKEKGNILAGVVSRVILGGFRPPHGSVRVEADINGESHLIGAVTFNHIT